MPFTLFEAAAEVGGNARTLAFAGHRFDTGAHRLHEDDPAVTEEIRALLGGRLRCVEAPSRIYVRGRMLDFPLSPFDLARSLDARTLARAALDKLRTVGRSASEPADFRAFAERRYGRTLARLLLLDYSEKLWGAPAEELSVAVAGGRLKGLDLKTFLVEALLGRQARTRHLDGRFYYPAEGYGAIMEALARAAGGAALPANLRTHLCCGTRVTALHHDGGRIRRVDVEGRSRDGQVGRGRDVDGVDAVVSTLPLPVAVRALRPAAPRVVLEAADRLRFRHLRLVVLVLDRPRFSPNASLYFPEPELLFTRIYEPKNRSERLSPADETAIVVEVPCTEGDAVAAMAERELVGGIVRALADRGLLRPEEVKAWRTLGLANAYPILEVGFEARAARLAEYLESFDNLYLVGRSARFEYTHVHRIFAAARDTIESIRTCSRHDVSLADAA